MGIIFFYISYSIYIEYFDLRIDRYNLIILNIHYDIILRVSFSYIVKEVKVKEEREGQIRTQLT